MTSLSKQSARHRYIGFDVLLLLVQTVTATKLLLYMLLLSLVLLVDQYWVIRISRILGIYVTLALHASSGLLAVFFIRNTVFLHIHSLHSQARSHSPEYHIAYIAVLMFGALLLIIPGMLTDICGILFILPPLRTLILRRFLHSHTIEIAKTKEHIQLIIGLNKRQKF